MQNPIMSMLMNQLQGRNPQSYNMVSQMMRNGVNPQNMLKQMMGNVNPTQMQQVLTQAKSFGVPDNILSQIQNFK